MADVNANIDINIDSSNALAQLKSLQRQIAQFHTSIARSSEGAALAQRGLQKNLLNSINSIGAFTAEMRTVKTSAESFTDSLEKNKFSMREYFRYAGASTKTFGRLFKSEFDTIGKVAEERVKTLQTQYIKMGRNASGAMEAIAIRPTSLDMQDLGTRTALAAQKQALFNQLMRQGSTNLLNFGKNTQWAGRQLMVGFTLPLMAVGAAATKTFMEMEAQALRFRKVYGDLFTPQEETQAALENITELGRQFTKYGVAVSTTVGLASEAAAAGFSGLDLQRQTTEATRLSILGQVDSQKALETTISLQNAFSMSSENLASSIDFLNAVENQTVVSLDDITTAIPKVAPVIQQLGGDVKDLAFFMAAMKEGGINASEGANALKSGLAALINPTGKAADMLKSYGINANAIVEQNKGDLKATVIGFAQALNQLDPLARARAIEQMFGKFQFARLSTLFANVAKDGNQASRVLDLANSSVENLAALSEKELGMTADSSMNKFKKSVEDLKFALIPVGEAFLEAVTPIVEFVGNILEKFGNLSDGTKKVITLLTVGIGAVGPVLLMTFGLLANGIANIIKLFLTLSGGYQRLTGQSNILGEQTQYMTMEQLDAAAAAHSLNQTHANLIQTFTAEASAIQKLVSAYQSAILASGKFATANPGMMVPPKIRKMAEGGVISGPGTGTSDSIPAMVSNGESIIPAKQTKKFGGLINAIIADNIPGFRKGLGTGTSVDVPGGFAAAHFGGSSQATGAQLIEISKGATQAVQNAILQMVNAFEDGMERRFTVFSNEVIATSTELNRAVGKTGSGKTAPIGLAKRDLIGVGAESRDIELQRQLTAAGVPIEEIKNINAKVTSSIEEGLTNLNKEFQKLEKIKTGLDEVGDITEVTAEDIDKLISDAYTAVAKTDERVAKAQQRMKDITAVTDPRNDSRVAVSKDPYIKFRKSGKYYEGMEDVVGKDNVPYQKNARFKITNKMAEEIGLTSGNAADVYNQFSNEVKIKLAGLRQDIVKFTAEFEKQAELAGLKTGQAYKVGVDKSSLKDIYVESRKRQSPHPLAPKDGKDDGTAYAAARDKATKPKRVATRTQGPPSSRGVAISDPAILGMAYQENAMRNKLKEQAASTQVMNQRMNRLNKSFMSGTFAISALSGVASMAGGNLGKFSEILFKISGPMFALSSILQLFTGQKIVSLLTKLGGLKLGLIAVGITALAIGIKLVNDARAKETEAIYGLSNAMKTTTAQVKTLGDFFSIVPNTRPFETTGTREIVGSSTRSARDRLKLDPVFKKEFAKTIETLSRVTADEAKLAFTSIALNLKAQGFATEQIQTIIDALREEAKKTSVILDVKSLDLSAESIQGLRNQITPLLLKLNAESKKGLIERSVEGKGNFEGYDIYTKESKKAVADLGTFIAETTKSITGMFDIGLIKAPEMEASLAGVLGTLEGLTDEARNLALIEIFNEMGVNALPFLNNLKTAEQTMMMLTLLGSKVISPDSGIMSNAKSTDPNVQLKFQRELNAAYENFIKIKEKINKQDRESNATLGKTGEVTLNALQERIKAIQNQTNAYIILRNAKIDEATATELSNDAAIASLVIANSKGKSLIYITELVNKYKKALAGQAKAESQYMSGPNQFQKQLEESQAQAALREKLIDMQFAPQIKKENDALTDQEKKLNDINKAIEKVTRSQIEPIQAVINSNSLALDKIALQEDSINEQYNKQIEALDKIASINQDIANIQKQRLSIADALTRGDISSAAQLIQDARAEQAQSAIGRQKEGLTANRDLAITALGRTAIEKQNKELQLQINIIEETQLKTLQAQKQTVEDTITSINENITALNNQVTVLKESALYSGRTKKDMDDLEDLIAKATAAGIPFTEELLKQAGNAQALAAALESALASMKEAKALESSSNGGGGLGPTPAGFEVFNGGADGYQGFGSGTSNLGQNNYGGISGKALGGIVTKYMANGGKAMGSDTVPAMLTPGEFVMNKRATKEFGPMLSMLNESKYPSMIGSSYSNQQPLSNNVSVSDNSTAVYNYSVGINVSNSNANPDGIAREVMNQIKYIDSQRIRGQR